MNKIVISLAIIGVVAGISFGITGAWWTDQATSANTSFSSGTMDLQLYGYKLNGNGDKAWRDNVGQTWDYEDMVPGGDPVGDYLWLRNNGSTPADWLKFDSVTNPSPGTMNEVMRITKLSYAGKSLLTDGASTDVIPTDCNIRVGHRNSESEPNYWFGGIADFWNIQEAIDNASADNTICVASGTYVENVVISADKNGLQLIGDGPESTIIAPTAGRVIDILAQNTNVENLRIEGFTLRGGDASIVLQSNSQSNDGYDGINYTYRNLIIDSNGYAQSAVGLFDVENVTLDNVIVKNSTRTDGGAIEMVGVKNLTITDSSIINNVIGIKMFAVSGYESNDNIQIHKSSLIGNTIAIENQDTWINARNNWWGDYDPSDQVLGSVSYDQYLGGPFIGFINGNDQNNNGFADLEDLHVEKTIVVEDPQLDEQKKFELEVQLDGLTSNNNHQGGTVGLDVTITMGQGPIE